MPSISRASVLAVAVAAAFAFSPRAAHAQAVSEADRQAARDLFGAGYQLQQAGNYAEALDKFKRAQAVFSAPTNLLHIAECEAQLGLLIESAETYRGIIRMPLPDAAPAAFGAAQTQAKAELQQVEGRIPKVRIEVAPPTAQNVGVQIDGQPMNVALLGVDRPIDPGTHRIKVFAPGFVPQEKAVVISEKEPPKVVSFALAPGAAGIIYAPPPTGLPPGVVLQQPGVVYPTPQYVVPGPQPYVLTQRPWTPPREKPHDWTYTGFMFGARLGAAVPSGASNGISEVASTGIGVGIEGYFRFAHKWFTGVVLQQDFYGKVRDSSSSSSTLAAADIGFTTNPEGVGFTMDFFLGYRGFEGALTNGSAEGGIGAGVWIAAGKSLRIIPRVEVSLNGGGGQDSTTSVMFFGGITILYNIDIKPKVVVAAPEVDTVSVEPAKGE
jgi:hypothetical protein